MTKRHFWKYLTRAHKWAGLVLGVQITLWFLSGFVMSLFPINEVRGRHVAKPVPWSLNDERLIPIEIAMTAYEGQLYGASLKSIVGEPAYILIGDQGQVVISAQTGEPRAPMDTDVVREAARHYYAGEGSIGAINLLTDAPREYRRAVPVWQVQFEDKHKTRIYIDAETAELNAVRTRVWRVFDFMWMLHIMDYKTRDNFNTWWLRLFSGAALLFALSGVALVVHRVVLRPRRVRV